MVLCILGSVPSTLSYHGCKKIDILKPLSMINVHVMLFPEKIHLVSGEVIYNPAHFIDASGHVVKTPPDAKYMYGDLQAVWTYCALATNKVRPLMPSTCMVWSYCAIAIWWPFTIFTENHSVNYNKGIKKIFSFHF